MLLLAVLNAAFRESMLEPRLGKRVAQRISGISLCMVILLITLAFVRGFGPLTRLHLLGVGVLWLLLTLVFELGFGRLVQRKSWEDLLAAYRFKDGSLWPLVLLMILFAPIVAAFLRA